MTIADMSLWVRWAKHVQDIHLYKGEHRDYCNIIYYQTEICWFSKQKELQIITSAPLSFSVPSVHWFWRLTVILSVPISTFVISLLMLLWLSPFSRFTGSSLWLSPFSRFTGSSLWLSPFSRFTGSSLWLSPFSRFTGSSCLVVISFVLRFCLSSNSF